MSLGRNFTFALDDSGGVEPLLSRKRQFFPGDHSFFLVAAVGLNDDLRPDFEAEWERLRQDMAARLGLDDSPPLHARLMFGKTKPRTYRERPNPYLTATDEDVLTWYLRGLSLLAAHLSKRGGGAVFTTVYDRREVGKHLELTFRQPEAEAEGEFLKLIDRGRYPRLHQKYLAHVTAALAAPTLDTFMAIHETVRQRGGAASILLDGYSDADGFREDAAFAFVRQHLGLAALRDVQLVPDSDNEALCQAADLVAYATFRSHLARYRQVEPEKWVTDSAKLLDTPPLCSLNVPSWLRRHREKPQIRALYSAARYALAHHEIGRYAPDVVTAYLKSPDEFLADCQALPERRWQGTSPLYLPILRAGTLEHWQVQRAKNGEDRSESGPVHRE